MPSDRTTIALRPVTRLERHRRVVKPVPERGASAAVRNVGVPAGGAEEVGLLALIVADFLQGGFERLVGTGEIRYQPRLAVHFDDHGAIARADGLFEKLSNGVAMSP